MNIESYSILQHVLPDLHPTPVDEKRFLLMSNASPSMIWITDQNGHPVFVNKTWLDLTGISSEQALTYEGWVKCIHPDDIKEAFKLYYCEYNTHEHISTEYRLKRADGCWRWILDHGVPFYNEQNQFSGYIGSAIDITERRLIEAEFRIAATAFESHEAMVITDANTVVLRVNRNFSELTGYTPDEIVGHKINLLKSDRHDEAFYKKMWESIDKTGSWQGEIWDKRKNGEIYPKLLTITAVKDEKGRTVNYVGTHVDITQQKNAQCEIERLAFYDSLTELPNRRLLLERLKHGLSASKRNLLWGAVMFIDMDNFKTLNDTLGHDMGDELLRQVARRLISCVRECDTVARLGGDEFVVMLENLDENLKGAMVQVEIVAKKILHQLNQNFILATHHYHSTPSIGITLFCGTEKQTADNVLKQADIAMYQAKASGRNALRFFNPQMQANVEKRFSLEEDLYQALLHEEFVVYYQAQTTKNCFIGAEALVRWIHPEKGLIPPVDFIPLAEESGLIIPLGELVFKTVFQQLKLWERNQITKHLQIAVNVSAKQFRQKDFVSNLENLLNEYQIQTNCLKLELTESILLENFYDVRAKMESLQKLGICFSIDDFGTGYSSLSYLTRLPLNQLKIDQSFIRNISNNVSDAVMVKTIIDMANNLGIEVISEGIETQEELSFLEKSGCYVHQGFLFGKPVPVEEFEAILATNLHQQKDDARFVTVT